MFRTEQIGDCKLYLGDCREVMASWPECFRVDAVVTDPPYGLGDRWSGGTWGANPIYGEAKIWDQRPIEKSVIDKIISLSCFSIIWGGNYYQVPPSRCWLIWDKTAKMQTMADFEMAWTNLDRPSKSFSENRNPDGKRQHPTQKPIQLIEWCLSFIPNAQNIFDPFMGSGTTGVACVKLDRKFIGIELEPKYFDIACRRIEAAYKEPRLPIPEPKPVQQSMDLT